MRVSKKCIDMVKEFEGLSLTAYQDSVGVWTIGWGVTSSDKAITKRNIVKGMKITEATAEKWLVEILNQLYLPKVLKYRDRYHFNTSQIDALVSFAYNIGSIDQLTQNGKRDLSAVEYYMYQYNKAGGRILPGLVRRRLAEVKMFGAGPKTFDEGFPKLPARGYFEEGDRGKEVEKVQKFLVWMDLDPGKIDGIYGKKTSEAVRELQGIAKTARNGKFGNKCLPFMKKYKK